MLIAGLLFLRLLLGPPPRAAFRVAISTRFAAGFGAGFALFFFKAIGHLYKNGSQYGEAPVVSSSWRVLFNLTKELLESPLGTAYACKIPCQLSNVKATAASF
jgi:hypothetical protein